MGDLPFKQRTDIERLQARLTKAGAPDLPFGYRWDSKDRLTGEEIRSLVMGHEFRDREIDTGEAYMRRTGADGTAKGVYRVMVPQRVEQGGRGFPLHTVGR